MRALSLAFPWVDLSGNSHVCLCCPGPVLMPPSLKPLGLSRQMWLLLLLDSHCTLFWPLAHLLSVS